MEQEKQMNLNIDLKNTIGLTTFNGNKVFQQEYYFVKYQNLL